MWDLVFFSNQWGCPTCFFNLTLPPIVLRRNDCNSCAWGGRRYPYTPFPFPQQFSPHPLLWSLYSLKQWPLWQGRCSVRVASCYWVMSVPSYLFPMIRLTWIWMSLRVQLHHQVLSQIYLKKDKDVLHRQTLKWNWNNNWHGNRCKV